MSESPTVLDYFIRPASKVAFFDLISKQLCCADRNGAWLACLNPHSYAVARGDVVFRGALQAADWLIPDGIGVVIAGRVLGCQVPERVTGFDAFEIVMDKLDQIGGSVFFLGSTEDTLDKICQKAVLDFPNVRILGAYSPPFKPIFSQEDNDAIVDVISRVEPDVLWVGMTAPKQEKWILENRDRLPVKFIGAIGAVFDFYSGKVKRSHPVFRSVGLEWLPRLVQEPKRLWRRMFVSAPIFLFDVFCSRLGIRTTKS